LECHLRRQVMRSFCVFLMSLVFLMKFHFLWAFLLIKCWSIKQNIHTLLKVELPQFQNVQWSEIRMVVHVVDIGRFVEHYCLNFLILSIKFDTWHWLVSLWTSWLMYLLYLYITKTVVPKNYKSPINKILHHNTNNKLEGTSCKHTT